MRSNSKEFNGRVFVLVLDDLNTSFSRTARVKLAARAVHRALPRRQRRRGDRPDRRRQGDRPGVHQQPRAAAARGQQLHGPEGAIGDARPDRRILPDARHRRDRPAARSERGNSRLQGAEHATPSSRTSPTTWPASAAGARPSCFFSEGIDYDIYDPIANTYAERHPPVQPGRDCRRHARQRQLLRHRSRAA